MKIRTRFALNILLFIVIFSLAAGSLLLLNQEIRVLHVQEEHAYSIQHGAYELAHLQNDYLFNGGERPLIQWENRYESLVHEIEEIDVASPDKVILVENLAQDILQLKELFGMYVELSESGVYGYDLYSLYWNRLEIKNQAMIFDASELSFLIRTDLERVHALQNIVLLLSVTAILVVFLANYLLVGKEVIRSLGTLEHGIHQITSGDRSARVLEEGDEEFRSVAASFNLMNDAIRDVEFELHKRIEDLNSAYEEMTAIEEELRKQFEDLTSAQVDLRQMTEYLDKLLTHANAGIVIWGTDLHIIRVNPAFERLIGKRADELIGEPIGSVLSAPMEERVFFSEHWESVEIPIIAAGGQEKTVLWSSSEIQNQDSDVIAMVAHGIDITERKMLEDLRLNALVQVEEQIRNLAILNDSIRNPLAVIVALCSMEDGENDKRILEQAYEIDNIITQLDQGWLESMKIREYIRKHHQ